MKLALTFDDVQILPCYSEIKSRSECDTSQRFKNLTLPLPIFSAPMDTVTEAEMCNAMHSCGGMGIIHRFMSIEDQVALAKKCKEEDPTCLVGAAVGVTGDYEKRISSLIIEGHVDLICFDIAHGHHEMMLKALTWTRGMTSKPIMAGNVATPEAVEELAKHGADIVKLGIGSGSLCTTRIETGVGVPMITCIKEASTMNPHVLLIADGGIRTSGDVAKAIAAGAHGVMLGSMLAGTKESPGILLREGHGPDTKLYKNYRGSASYVSKADRGESSHVEGTNKTIGYKGKVKRIMDYIRDGLTSSMSYVGAYDLNAFKREAQFIRVTQAGRIEASPHLL
jgi:IMP dehydrogenase